MDRMTPSKKARTITKGMPPTKKQPRRFRRGSISGNNSQIRLKKSRPESTFFNCKPLAAIPYQPNKSRKKATSSMSISASVQPKPATVAVGQG
jgi:hypothetical protein